LSKNDRRDLNRGKPMTDPRDGDPTQSGYLDEREEWGPGGVADETTAPQPVVPSGSRPSAPSLPPVVRGIARGVELRKNPEEPERLVFRLDHYDRDGNRLTPVPVELTRFRRGLVTDGDEVEVAGRWSHGTLLATRITNLSTASEVRGWSSRATRWIAFAVVLAVALIAAAILVVVLTVGRSSAHTVAVPDVAGKDEAAAVAAIRSAGLSVTRFPEPSADVAKGTVIRTEPDAGVRIDKHAPVILIVSLGPTPFASSAPSPSPTPAPSATTPHPIATAPPAPATVAMIPIPNVAGQTQQDGTDALKNAGFAVEVHPEDSADVPAGSVTRTDPPALTLAARGSTVKIFISTPSTTTTAPLP
jgi:serine/threonine-protein kinase